LDFAAFWQRLQLTGGVLAIMQNKMYKPLTLPYISNIQKKLKSKPLIAYLPTPCYL